MEPNGRALISRAGAPGLGYSGIRGTVESPGLWPTSQRFAESRLYDNQGDAAGPDIPR